MGQRAREHSLGVFEAQRTHQRLVFVGGNVSEFLNNWFRLDVAVRKLVIVRPLRVKDRLDDGALCPPAPVHRSFVVVLVESLHDVLPKGFLALIALFERSFFLRHELCERPEEAEVKNICVGRVRRLSDEPDDGCLLAVDLPAHGAKFDQILPEFHVRSSTVHLDVHTIVPQQVTLYVRYQFGLHRAAKHFTIHLAVSFIPLAACVKLAVPLRLPLFGAPMYSNNAVEVALRASDGIETHDLVNETLRLDGRL